jgi:hypothetical protein
LPRFLSRVSLCGLPRSAPLVLALFSALALAPVTLRRWLRADSAFALGSMATAGLLLTLESALICSGFVLRYHFCLAYWWLFLGLIVVQAFLSLVSAGLGALASLRCCGGTSATG